MTTDLMHMVCEDCKRPFSEHVLACPPCKRCGGLRWITVVEGFTGWGSAHNEPCPVCVKEGV